MSAAATLSGPFSPLALTNSEPPSRSARLISLVRRLIDYGKALVSTLQQRADDPALALTKRAFGTLDAGRIIARILCGLRRAEALEQRIVDSAVSLDTDAPSSPSRRDTVQRASTPRAPRTVAAEPARVPLPSVEDIAERVRRQPIGAVLADICRDLGILPSHPLWRELSVAIIHYRGSLATLVRDINHTLFPLSPEIARLLPRALRPRPTGAGPPEPISP